MPEENDTNKDWTNKIKSAFFVEKTNRKYTLITFISAFALMSVYLSFHTPPIGFPKGEIFTIKDGQSLQEITYSMVGENVVKYGFVFRTHVIFLGGENRVIAGDYLLDKKEGPADLAYRVVNGEFHLDPIRITIPEGWNIFEIGDYLSKTLVNFNMTEFVNLAKEKEGYLFPDTYFVTPTIKPITVIDRMQKNFNEKVPKIPGLSTTTYPIKDVISMASILEREARTMENRRIIAGILWKRLQIGMPLQVDASFDYINGKSSEELTLDDLKIDSPYNSYLYKGFPPTPIGNPGEDSIIAAINPIKTNYLFFLSSKEGKMHYAITFEEHKKNKEKYLR